MKPGGEKPEPDVIDGVSFADAAVDLDELEAAGFFSEVTDDMRRAAHAEFAKIFAARNPPEVWPGRSPGPVSGDMFGGAA